MKISFIGTGNVATNLGVLFENAGHEVFYGARTPSGSQVEINQAIQLSKIICITVPYQAVQGICEAFSELFKEKVVVDITNPIHLQDWSPIYLGASSAAEQLAQQLPGSKVVKAFNAIFADVMGTSRQTFGGIPLTAFIASDHEEALTVVARLAEDAGFSSQTIKGLRNARYLEGMAHLNIAMALAGGGTDAGFVFHQRR